MLLFAALSFLACCFFLSRPIIEALLSLSRRTPTYISVFEPFFNWLGVSVWAAVFASPSIEMRLSISTFITFYMMLAASALVIVLIPVVTFLLLKLGVKRLEGVSKARKYLIPVFLFIAAVITPPDPASMIIVFIPLWTIFELSLLVFRLMLRRQSTD